MDVTSLTTPSVVPLIQAKVTSMDLPFAPMIVMT